MDFISDSNPFWHDFTLMLAVTAFVTASFRKIGWNPILGLVAAGATIGPQGFHLLSPGSGAAVLGELGVLFLLFAVGMQLSPDRLKTMARWIFGLGGSHFVLSSIALGLMVYYLGMEWKASIVVGISLSMSSTAFVLQLLSERGEINARFGQKTFSVLLFQDLMVAPILAFLPILAGSMVVKDNVSAVHILPAIVSMFVIFMIVRMLLENVLGVIHATARADAFPAAILFTALAMGWAAKSLGLGPSLGAFLAGFAISGANWRREVRDAVGPFESTLLGFFFISIGLRVPIDGDALYLLKILGATFALISVKVMIGFIACSLNGVKARDGLRASLALAQAGEFSFIVLTSASEYLLLPKWASDFWSSVAVLSIVMTPFLIHFARCLKKNTDKPLAPVNVSEEEQKPKEQLELFSKENGKPFVHDDDFK